MNVMNPYNYKKIKGVSSTSTSGTSLGTMAVKTPSKTDVYLEQKIMNAKPEELTLMLYDGMIKFIKQSKVFNEQKDVEKANNANIRAQHIVEELRATLNMDIPMSINLDSLYDYIHNKLIEANIKKDNEILDEVLSLATDLRDAWKEAMNL